MKINYKHNEQNSLLSVNSEVQLYKLKIFGHLNPYHAYPKIWTCSFYYLHICQKISECVEKSSDAY